MGRLRPAVGGRWVLRGLLAGLVVGALALGGCGDGGSFSSGGSDQVLPEMVDPCTLVQRPEAEAALGTTASEGSSGAGVPTSLVGERACQFRAAGGVGQVRVGVVTAFADTIFNRYKEQQRELVGVSGLGSDAVWNDARDTLVVLAGQKVLTVVVFRPEVKDRRERASRLAEKALDRL